MDNSNGKRLSPQGGKSRLNEVGLRKSKRRRTSVGGGGFSNALVGVETRPSGADSVVGTSVPGGTNVVSFSVIPPLSSASANSVKIAGGLSRISKKPIKSHRTLRISRPFHRDSLKTPLRSRINNSNVPENELKLVRTERCRNTMTESKIWTSEYSPTSVSEMILHSNDVSSLLEWMRLWDTDVQTVGAKNSSNSSAGKRLNGHISPSLESMSSWRQSAYLIFGPTGCGKTSLVYALAAQNGYKVFELNPSSCRSGREVMAQCSPLMVSQHVSTESSLPPSSVSDLSEIVVPSSSKMRLQSRKSLIDPFSLPPNRLFQQNISRLDSAKRGAPEGLKLINKSLIFFDDVDVLFDTDRGFWYAVGKLLQMGRRPIFFTASDPSVLHKIPVPYQTCKLLPLTSSILVKPVLQRICDSRGLILTDSLMLALTRRENEDCNLDIPGRISSTARELVSNREFSNIRQSIVRLQWIASSGDQCLDEEGTGMSRHDLISTYNSIFYRLFSLFFVTPQVPLQDPPKSADDEFIDVFASDAEEKPSVPEEHGKRDISTVVKLPLTQCKKLSADVLLELSRATELQALLDMCSTVSSQSEISRGIESLPLDVTSSPNLLTVFGDVCSAPLSGIDPVGMCGTFACEEDWRRLLHLTTLRNLTRLEEQLLALPTDSESLAFGGYVNGHSSEGSFFSTAFNKAVATLASLRAFNAERKSGEGFFQRECALDFLPSLRSIGRAELYRKSLATRRRFFHYFDRIGLRLPQDICEFLSQ